MNTKTTPQPASGGLGRGLFASTDIAVGEEVLHIPVPFVAVLDTEHLGEVCSGCFGQRQLEEEGIALKGCRGCGVVKYCDKVKTCPLHSQNTITNSFRRHVKQKTGNWAILSNVPSIRN